MGWYFRKSIGFGPFRVNLSKSGVGYSFGVRGARVGTGPRGNYVRLGRGGLYYQQYFGGGSGTGTTPVPPATLPVPGNTPPPATTTGTPIPTAQAGQLQPSTAAGVLQQLQNSHSKATWTPIYTALAPLGLIVALFAGIGMWSALGLSVLLVIGHLYLQREDAERKFVSLDFDLDGDARLRYLDLLSGCLTLAQAAGLWRVTSQLANIDPKYNAGAQTSVSRRAASMRASWPRFVESNVGVWHLDTGDQQLFFFPDRILVYDSHTVGAVEYRDLQVQSQATRFVEEGSVPSDSVVVGQTWQYTNKSGGPDRRFSSNRQLPVLQYCEIAIASTNGLNLLLQVSSSQKAQSFVAALQRYAARPMPKGNTQMLASQPASASGWTSV
jgi:hypothetical protein